MSLFKKEGPVAPEAPPVAALPGGEAMSLKLVEYNVVKNKFTHLEWAREGNNYVYQWKTVKPTALDERTVLSRLIALFDDFLPKETHVFFDKPIAPGNDGDDGFPFFTVSVKDIASRPGAEDVCERKLVEALSKLNVWT